MWFAPIFGKKRSRNPNFGNLSWAPNANSGPYLVDQSGFADEGFREITGYRWIRTISIGAYGRFDSTNIFQNASSLSSCYRASHPAVFQRFRDVLRITSPNLWRRAAE